MRLRLIAVGRLRKGNAGEAAADYSARISALVPFETVELPSSSSGKARAAAEESARILRALGEGRRAVLLDERGGELSTAELAAKVSSWMNSSADVDFVIGGAWGVDDSVRSRADETWALSRLTLPHELARVVALEALYRALTVVRGLPYHHA